MTSRIAKLTKIIACILVSNLAYAGQIPPVVIDVYGSQQITAPQLQELFAEDFARFAQALTNKQNTTSAKFYSSTAAVGVALAKKILPLGGFDQVAVSYKQFSHDPHIYFMVDTIEKKTAAKFSGMQETLKKSYPDPDNLIDKWYAFDAQGLEDYLSGRLSNVNSTCPEFYCVWGYGLPAYKVYQERFEKLVPVNFSALATILHADKDPKKRSAAAFLLAHSKDLSALTYALLPAVQDSAYQVRADVMLILATALSTTHAKLEMPLAPVIAALKSPYSVERNSALALLATLAKLPSYAKDIKNLAGDELLIELKMQQPEIHTYAYQILQKISGKGFAGRDYLAWQNWLSSAALTP